MSGSWVEESLKKMGIVHFQVKDHNSTIIIDSEERDRAVLNRREEWMEFAIKALVDRWRFEFRVNFHKERIASEKGRGEKALKC
ncbi:MAG: hypothetical protein M1153_01315 [Patescibacteria group bacterium]|nr:hypothetical protein [Patescibacteria group bacterium]